MDKLTAIKRFAESRTALLKLIQQMIDYNLVNVPVEGEWTIKDMLCHITAWDQTLLEPMQRLVRGDSFSPQVIPDHDVFNAQQAGLRRKWSLQAVMDEMESVRASFLATVQDLPEAAWIPVYLAPWGDENSLANLIGSLAWHEMEHCHTIQQWFEARTE